MILRLGAAIARRRRTRGAWGWDPAEGLPDPIRARRDRILWHRELFQYRREIEDSFFVGFDWPTPERPGMVMWTTAETDAAGPMSEEMFFEAVAAVFRSTGRSPR